MQNIGLGTKLKQVNKTQVLPYGNLSFNNYLILFQMFIQQALSY